MVANDDIDDLPEDEEDELELQDSDARPPVRPAGPIRRKTVGGAMLAAAMIGMQEVLEGPKDEPITIEIGSGTGGDDDDPMARTNPWELEGGAPTIDEGTVRLEQEAPGAASRQRARRRR